MAKGSQLKQLRSELSHAGVLGPSQSSKNKKRAATDAKKKADKLVEIHRRLNPFDIKVTKLKHDVGGRKIKGVMGKPGASKQAGLDERKRTLLKEYEERHRAGDFVDRRFGENDPTMTPEDRMLERFTRERQRASKGTAFNLDGDEDLTHYGQSLSKLDDFDNTGITLEDEYGEGSGQVDAATVKHAHFGGFEEEEDNNQEPERQKSKAEVMAEVIAKSKEHKMQRQMEKKLDEETRHGLDEDFDAIRSLLLKTARAQSPVADMWTTPEDQDVDYDQHVRQLAFDQRARAKDRTKTEEELAFEAKEALEKAERNRLKRMLGEDDRGDESPRSKRRRADDGLDDDFTSGMDFDVLGEGLTTGDHGEDAESFAETDSEHQSEVPDDDVELASELGDSDSENDQGDQVGLTSAKRLKDGRGSDKEMPFTFPCPSTHDEFLQIVDGVNDDAVDTIVQRIRIVYHASLAEDNKFLLQTFASILIDHILYAASPPQLRFALVSRLTPHLFSLTRAYPLQCADHFISKLSLMQKNLMRGLSQGALDAESKTWPGPAELALLRVTGLVWSSSDFHHAVVSAARLLMGAYLGLARVRSICDLASGLFLCTLFAQYESFSKRLVPEVVAFLARSLLYLIPSAQDLVADAPYSNVTVHISPLRINERSFPSPSRKPDLSDILNGRSIDDEAKRGLLSVSISLLERFSDMHKGLSGFVDLFNPVRIIVGGLHCEALPATLQVKLAHLEDTLSRLLKFAAQARLHLTLQVHKPIPIPSYVPKFESSSSNYLRSRNPDHEKHEAAKLRSQLKKEKKGAVRELRKDTRFLANVRQTEQREKDRSYKERMSSVFGSIESERAEEKAMDREKQKQKRKSGWK